MSQTSSSQVTIAVDAMGGDKGLKVSVAGCALALKKVKDFNLILVGDESRVKYYLKKHKLPSNRVRIVHAEEEVLIDLAAQLETASPWINKKPNLD